MSRIGMFRAYSKYILLKKMTSQKCKIFKNLNSFVLFDTVGICQTLQTNPFDKQPRNFINITLSRVRCS